ncbi:MAG: hypothetical protein JXK94_14795 [Deltaproteobacteria bacterium]|nr:hypothetical protein [Deltaproteobacteria bacterium]
MLLGLGIFGFLLLKKRQNRP